MVSPTGNEEQSRESPSADTAASGRRMRRTRRRQTLRLDSTITIDFRWIRRLRDRIGHALTDLSAPERPEEVNLPLSGTRTIRAVYVLLFFTFGLGSVWAGTARLDAASIAPGIVVVDGQRKTVQHLEGGIVKAIHVADGDTVEVGQILIEFRDDVLQGEREKLQTQWVSAMAKRDRLIAERSGATMLAFSDRLAQFAALKPWAADILALQQALFDERTREIAGRMASLQERRRQSEQQIAGLTAQLTAQRSRLDIAREEHQMAGTLFEKGYASKVTVLAHKREIETTRGTIGDLVASIAAAKQQIAEIDQEIINLEVSWTRSMGEELERLNDHIPELESGIAHVTDQLQRSQVRAPAAGTIVGLAATTIGGVIGGSSTIMEIVPQDKKLIVEALVTPQDIDVVREGQTVNVRLTSFSIRTVPPVPGTLVQLSADRVADPRSGSSAYLARIHLDGPALDALEKVSLQPGMPAEVLIQLGQRTFLDYFLAPLLRTFERGLKEE